MSSDEFMVAVPMPFTGVPIVDGVLVSWLVEPGDQVNKGQNIAEIETEKSVWEMEAPCAGEIVTLRAEPGDVVEVKAPLVEMKTVDEDVRHLLLEERAEDEGEESAVTVGERPGSGGRFSRLDVGPRVRRLLRDAGIDEEEARSIPTMGRLAFEEVKAYLSSKFVHGKAPTTYLAGIGAYIPSKIVDNSDLLFPDLGRVKSLPKVLAILTHILFALFDSVLY